MAARWLLGLILLGCDGTTDGDAPELPQQHVMLVVIDGARYTETLGDPLGRHVPRMAELARTGCAPGPILNTGDTVTIAGMSVIHTGAWDAWIEDAGTGEVYQAVPTHWEYFRKQAGMDESQAFYILEDYGEGVWKPSRDPDYGEAFWPTIVARGDTDQEVFENARMVLEQVQPAFAVVYLAAVDGAGHSGDWGEYTAALEAADAIVGHIWDLLQASPFYAGSTTLIVTSDHGRHDDAHGGFDGHGDGCDGCRQVAFLAVGPQVDHACPPAYPPRTLADITPTIGRILGTSAEKSEGVVMEEIFIH
jgi:hypothetical protein